MKFSILKNNFLEGLNTVSRALSPTPVFEILKGIKIELDKNKMILKASDSLLSMEYFINTMDEDKEIINVERGGEAVLPSRYFIEIIKKLPTNQIDIEIENQYIKIKSGKSEFNIQGYEPNEYPEFPTVSKENKLEINSTVFNSITKETLFCTAQNDQRPILEGVNFILEEKVLTATSTDSHRLSKRKLKINNLNENKEFNIIIPKKALQSIQKIIESKENNLEIYYEDNRVIFIYENIIYYVLLISGKYPNTEKLIPSTFECVVNVESQIFYDAVDRVSLVSKDEKNDIVKFTINGNIINITSNSKELGTAKEDVFAEIESQVGKFEIAASAKFLKEAIGAINSEKVVIKFSGELTAFTMQPSDYHRDIIEVLLPVRTY
ncbi:MULTISPECIES: DNA polymerase III subunit beta [unclassified Gemella]|uniref:DNA polymerase III subunit beta n=1 Tax=unclassified Gemella TaxID=2624949 RepID=UPI001C045089|nr:MULTISPECIES: DNA polymerase III subunit beta [unclassified Gemella]MBU0279039.1 DNA polymerase III subunit beta [Gemella sp. zg-1178]QWQ38792.1 DNA polymerase III subunit beta [Gemella sp. zg-570]